MTLRSQSAADLCLQFLVRDTGIGIPQDKQKMIFDAFSQADGSTTRKFGGTGLGLTISARLVEAMGGKIWVESAFGKGSCFHFTAALGVSSETRQLARLAEAIPLAGIRVVVVDDNLTNRRILSDMLWSWGMLPAPAASGPEALAHLRRGLQRGQPYSLVVTDVHMPEMDGFELVRRIHETPELTQPVILMLTSGDRGDDIARCRKLGIASYLTKPVRRAELRASIIAALAREDPRVDLAVRARGTTSDVLPTDHGASCRILLAEDNVVNQRVALRILEKAGHIVALAENGKVALSMLAEQTFDLILMDVQMPEMGGFEATALIRQKGRIHGPAHSHHRDDRARDGRRPRTLPRRRHGRLCGQAGGRVLAAGNGGALQPEAVAGRGCLRTRAKEAHEGMEVDATRGAGTHAASPFAVGSKTTRLAAATAGTIKLPKSSHADGIRSLFERMRLRCCGREQRRHQGEEPRRAAAAVAHQDSQDRTLLLPGAGAQNQGLRAMCPANQLSGEHGARGRFRLRSDHLVDGFVERLGGGDSKQALRGRVKEGQVSAEIVREGGVAYVAQNLQQGGAGILHGVLEAPVLARDAIQRRGIPPQEERQQEHGGDHMQHQS